MTSEFSTDLMPPSEGPVAGRGERRLSISGMVRRRMPLMTTVFVVLAAPLLAASWFLVPLGYRAEAAIRFMQDAPHVLFQEEGQELSRSAPAYERFVETQVKLIQSAAILNRVLSDADVQKLPWIAGERDPLSFLQDKVRAQRGPGTELVIVSCKAADRATALLIVNKTVQKYMDFLRAQESTRGEERKRELLAEQKRLEAELATQQQRAAVLRKQIGEPMPEAVPAGTTEIDTYRKELSEAKSAVAAAETDVHRAEDLLSEVSRLAEDYERNPGSPVFEHKVEDRVSSDSSVVVLRGELASLGQQLAVFEERFVSDAPQLKVLQRARSSLSNRLAEAEQKARGEALRAAVEEARQGLASATRALQDAQKREELFTGLVNDYNRRVVESEEARAAVKEWEQKAEDTRSKLNLVASSLYAIEVESNAPAGVREAAEATAPHYPDFGQRLQFMLLAVVVSAGIALSTGAWRELTDQSLRSTQDVALTTGLPIIAVVPHADVDRLPKKVSLPLVTAEYPTSTTADEFRRVLTRIVYPPEGSAELKTVLVASPSRGDGKTSLACNVAIALAQANRSVLLVDVSTRQPKAEEALGLSRGAGLAEVMLGTHTLESVIQPTRFANLSVLGPGFQEKDVLGKLASREALQALEEAEASFDHVIIDTPPSLLMSEAKLLAPVADGVFLVVGADVSTVGMVRRCVRDLREVGANLVGVVLNGVRPTRGGYLRDNLAMYYAYSEGGGAVRATPQEPVRAGGKPGDRAHVPSILLVDEAPREEDESDE